MCQLRIVWRKLSQASTELRPVTAHQLSCITSCGRIYPEVMRGTAYSSTIVSLLSGLMLSWREATAVTCTCVLCFPNFLNPNELYPHPFVSNRQALPKESSFPFITTGLACPRCIPQPPRQGVSCGPQSGRGGP